MDPVNNEIYVTESNSILVSRRDATGDVAPIRVLGGPNTEFNGNARALTVDPINNVLIVTGEDSNATSVVVWSIHDNGDVPPRFILGGPKSGMRGGAITLNPKAKEVIVGGQDALRTYSFPEIF